MQPVEPFHEKFCVHAADCCQNCRFCLQSADSKTGLVCVNPEVVITFDTRPIGEQAGVYPSDVCNLYDSRR